MPIIKSAKKRVKQTKKRTESNKVLKDTYREKIREVKKGVGILDSAKMSKKVSEAYKAIDKAAKKNILHKNNAARKKSNLAKLVKAGGEAKPKKKTKGNNKK